MWNGRTRSPMMRPRCWWGRLGHAVRQRRLAISEAGCSGNDVNVRFLVGITGVGDEIAIKPTLLSNTVITVKADIATALKTARSRTAGQSAFTFRTPTS